MRAKIGAITIGQSPRVDVVPEMLDILGPDGELIGGVPSTGSRRTK